MADQSQTLPSGVTPVFYTSKESRGPLALVITASVSMCAVLAMLIAMAVSGFKTNHQFIRSQVGAYFLSLVLSDLLQATGSIMNSRWVVIQGVSPGPFCTLQAALKQTGNVGTALWSLVIAIHTFCLLFLRLRIGDHIFYTILIGVWLLLAFVVMMGPLILETPEKGPFFGISGFWCWITDPYEVEQLMDEYLFMFITAGVSIILYSLIFLRLRGNLHGFGWSLRFRRVKQPWVEDEADESQMSLVGKQMLWYPVAYTFIILPIAACRWSTWFHHDVPYWATMTADSIFMLSGFVNAILYSTTRKIVSVRALLPFRHLIRIGTARSSHTQEINFSTKSLDDMEFTIPVSPVKRHAGHASMTPVTPLQMWHPRSGAFAEYTLKDHLSHPGLSTFDSVSEYSDVERTLEHHAASVEDRVPMTVDECPSTSSGITRIPCSSEPHADARFPRPRTKLEESTVAEGPAEHASREPSEKSVTTDGAPSLHRKRFSGWSLPSVGGLGAATPEGEEDVQTDMESMRFAPPSPQPPPTKALPSSRSSSDGDLQVPKWPPRVDPFNSNPSTSSI